ncbi:MAG: polysaccharide biosynthesis C-terminal domain-containing protein [Acidimicrobiales bacterium]
MALAILACGQFINTAAGLVGELLAMSGRELRLLQATGASAVCNVGLNLLLIPRMGIEGAAVATLVSLVVVNGLYILFVHSDLEISLISRPRK